ncbi:hypothetical protein V6095_02865, partial [Klebsiella pneumoniae]
MATLQWDHAVQFVNQPEAAIEIFAGQQLRAVAGKDFNRRFRLIHKLYCVVPL